MADARWVRPEILAPAGDEAAMDAAVKAGADAVYFGLQAFNARARATNFGTASLPAIMQRLHRSGVRGYVTLNTLVFEPELPAVQRAIEAAADARVDALIVQDLGVARLAREVAPNLAIHASTQMTCTDSSGVELARSLGASRVVLARELSLEDIAAIRARTDAELEVFVHGALCMSYSGQCLTSEAIGGRSANRGACAQACRLPYELVVDGVRRELGEKVHLLSPQDLETSALVPALAELGVVSLKIEGRLKGPEYVAAATRLYRAAVDALGEPSPPPLEALRRRSMLTYSRGSGPGFMAGIDHQRLVEGRSCEHRGLPLGTVNMRVERRRRSLLRTTLGEPLARGDGILVEGGLAGRGEVGGRVWTIEDEGADVEQADAGREVLLWLGPDVDLEPIAVGRRIFKTDDPRLDRELLEQLERQPFRVPLQLTIRGARGEPFTLVARSARGHLAEVVGDTPIGEADGLGLGAAVLEDKLGRLGDTPFVLETLTSELPERALIPVSALNRARRSLIEALAVEPAPAPRPVVDLEQLKAGLDFEARPTPPPGLFVLARTFAQAEAALEAGADGVYLDFLELVGLGRAVEALRARNAPFVGIAPPRIRKPGEEKIDRHLRALKPDAILVRGLGPLHEAEAWSADLPPGERPLRVGDFSLNVTHPLSAWEVLRRGVDLFTPSFDLDASQLIALLGTRAGRLAEVVVHHPMPLFHDEHCLYAALLSSGKDHRTCGRPCDRHKLSLRDRAGMDHPVEADVGCRNTIFHAAAQSAAAQLVDAQRLGVGRFRIELVRETAEDTRRVVETYRALAEGRIDAAEVFRRLATPGGYGVVRGSLRVLDQNVSADMTRAP